MNVLRYSPEIEQLEKAPTLSNNTKSAVSAAARNVNRALAAVGTESPKADFFGHPFVHPPAEPYFSQAPIRFGDYVAKIGVFPADAGLEALAGHTVDTREDDNAFRSAVVDYFAEQGARFELRVQLWNNAESQPIEDASVEWSQDESEFRTVASVEIPAQDAYSTARQQYFDERMTFQPAHSLAAHRPLGSVMRARLKVYAALSDHRARINDTAPENLTDPADIPR